MPTMSYFFNAISYTKDIEQFTDGEIEKDYKPYVMNRMIAQYKNLIFFADEMNRSHNIPKKYQLEFYMKVIPKKKRRALWATKDKVVDIQIIMDYYNISQEKAEEYMKILSKEQINKLGDVASELRKYVYMVERGIPPAPKEG